MNRARAVRVVQGCLLALVGLVWLKFLAILADSDWDVSQAPLPLLVVVTVPAIALVVLVSARPRVGAAVSGALLLVFAVFVVSALARDGLARESWADYPFAYGGLAIAAPGLYAVAQLLRGRRAV